MLYKHGACLGHIRDTKGVSIVYRKFKKRTEETIHCSNGRGSEVDRKIEIEF